MGRVTPVTRHFALVGWPLGFSLSPAMHNAAFRAAGIDADYALLPTDPDDLGRVAAALRSSRLHGANVTVPHKARILEHLDRVSPTVRRLGAANTVVVRANSELVGYNTDVDGFRASLEALADGHTGRAVVLGAGGAARAAVHALLEDDWSVTVLNRTPERAAALAADLAGDATVDLTIGPLEPRPASQAGRRADLLVNATSVGADGESDPWPDAAPLPGITIDLVAWPPVTPLVARARTAGGMAVGGLPMLVVQAALAFELWTGQPPPEGVMRDAALSEISRHDAERDSAARRTSWARQAGPQADSMLPGGD